MKEDVLISIVVPIYNVEKYLAKCINSLLNQSYHNLEVILVNDGSKDNSLSICKEYEQKDYRIKVINKENGGLSDARNEGMQYANGQYIMFVDSDDYIHYQMVEFLYYEIIKNDAEIAICDYKCVSEKEIVKVDDNILLKKESANVKLFSGSDIILELYGLDFPTYTVAWNKLYKKSLFNDVEYPVGKIHEDEFTTYKLLYKASKIVRVFEPMYYYVQRESSIMSQPFSEKRFHKVEAYKERLDFLISKHIHEETATKWYLWTYYSFLLEYIAASNLKRRKDNKYDREFKIACKKYRKYIKYVDYIKIYLKYKMKTVLEYKKNRK